ncbi:hypothetical protein A2159_01255, partial [Candidatus Woesebacteria bacterium RBG_13_34_9]
FIFRLYKLESPLADWHSWRQADTASVTRIFVSDGINLLYPRYYDISSVQTGIFNPIGFRFVEFPVFNAIHAFFVLNFSFFNLEVWGRLVSIFSSLICIFFIYLIGKRFMGTWGGLLSAGFFSFIPFNIYFSRVILPEPMATMFAIVGLYLFIKFIDSNKSFYLLTSGVFFALGILVKPFVAFYLVPVVYLIFKNFGLKEIYKTPRLLIKLLLYMDIVLVPFLLWRGWINKYPEGIPHFLWAFNGDKIRFKPSFWRWIFGERLGNLILGSWGLIPFSFGILTKLKNKFGYFIQVTLLGMLMYVTLFATASVRHDYYQTITIPAISLALASGVLVLWKSKDFNRILSRSLIVLSISVMFIIGAFQVREFYKINHPEIIEAGNAADRLLPKNALIIAPYNGDTAFLYQTNRQGWP